MQLTLIRHGEAAPAIANNDQARPLTARGEQQAAQTAAFIQQQLQPDVFVVSPLLRAQQTLAHLQAYYPQIPVVLCDAIKPEDDAKIALQWLSHLPYQSIVVVCHMNVIGYLAQQLTADDFYSFALAEAAIYEQEVISKGFSSKINGFIPNI